MTFSALQGWSDERSELLRKWHAKGLCFAQIAAALGDGLSRNACIGKAKRMGLHRRDKAEHKTTRAKPIRPTLPTIVRHVKRLVMSGNGVSHIDAGIEVEYEQCEPTEIPMSQRKQLLDLRMNDCRWPYGDPGKSNFFFCGAEKQFDHPSYCPAHVRQSTNRHGGYWTEERRERAKSVWLLRQRSGT